MKFEELNISQKIKNALEDINHIEMTEIQEKAISPILEGKDVIGQSKTGTGKTAAFGLPIIEKIDTSIKATQVLVLCPTRELAVQEAEEIRKYTKYIENLRILAIYGGQGIERQIGPLKGGVQLVIGTPGRIMDHMRRKTLKLENVTTVVLDEADEMLNMGFEEDIQTILKDIPENRQTILFSATMNDRILKLTKKYLKNPVNIKIQSKELTVDSIEQTVIEMKHSMKDEALTRLIDLNKPKKAIIFCNTKKKVDSLLDVLKSQNYNTEGLHGDIKQAQRDRVMKKLKNGEIQILVATDVVARGIDIEDLDLVINYDIPQDDEYYVHRIGRTGRNGHNGKSFTFAVGKEMNKIYSIQKYAHTKLLKGKIPSISEINAIRNKEVLDKIQEVIDSKDFQNEDLLKDLLNQNENVDDVLKALFTMATVKTKKFTKEIEQNSQSNSGTVKLFLSVGKKDKIMVKDIVGSLAANATISGSDIGKIKILDNFSFVEVPSNYVEEILDKMVGKKIKGKNVSIEIANAKN